MIDSIDYCEHMNNFKLKFGKYKDRQLSELVSEDGGYLIWLFKQVWLDDDTKKALDSVINNVKLGFGRYKGNTIGYLKFKNPKYIEWLFKASETNK
jgi:uncharacterized protein (DUF3820 family)